MSNTPPDFFKLRNPNRFFILIGISLPVISALSILLNLPQMLIGIGITLRLLVVFWVPNAARLTGRHPLWWSVFSFLVPSVSFTILGSIGFKANKKNGEIISLLSKRYEKKRSELKNRLNENQITIETFNHKLFAFYDELQEEAKESLSAPVNSEYLNKRLRKKGYVLDENAEVFVEFENKCPACNAKIEPQQKECPECGLFLY